jgi:ribosomal protein L6P/L9E
LFARFLDIPEGVTVTCNARHVKVEGPRGVLEQKFKHVDLDMQLVDLDAVVSDKGVEIKPARKVSCRSVRPCLLIIL